MLLWEAACEGGVLAGGYVGGCAGEVQGDVRRVGRVVMQRIANPSTSTG